MIDFGIWDVGFYRFFGGLLLLLALFGRRGNPFHSGDTRLLILRGCTGSVAFMAYIFAVGRLPVSTALMLLYAYPAFAALFSAWLYREKVSASGWWCLVTVLSGVAILVNPAAGGIAGGTSTLAGYLAGMLSAVFAGLTIAIVRRLKQSNGAVVIYLYFCAVGTVVTAPFFLSAPTLPRDAGQGALVAGIVLFSLLGQLVMNQGFGHCKSYEGGLYMTSEVVLTALAGIMLLDDPVDWRFWTGGALILASAVMIQLDRSLRAGEK